MFESKFEHRAWFQRALSHFLCSSFEEIYLIYFQSLQPSWRRESPIKLHLLFIFITIDNREPQPLVWFCSSHSYVHLAKGNRRTLAFWELKFSISNFWDSLALICLLEQLLTCGVTDALHWNCNSLGSWSRIWDLETCQATFSDNETSLDYEALAKRDPVGNPN